MTGGVQGDDGRLAKEIAYDYLKDMILAMDPREGRFIKEEEVAEATGISRTPVREAFLRLDAERLLRLVVKKGAFVPPISDREIVDLMELRLLLEEFTAVQAIGAPPVIGQLEDLLEGQKKAAQNTEDPGDYINLDLQFHAALIAAAGNEVIADMYQALRNRQLRLGRNVLAVSSERRFEEVIKEHQAIIDALRTKEVGAVRTSIRDHLNSTLLAALGRPDGSHGLFRTLDDDSAA